MPKYSVTVKGAVFSRYPDKTDTAHIPTANAYNQSRRRQSDRINRGILGLLNSELDRWPITRHIM